MKLHDLRPAPGSHKPKRRVGRGIAGGQGKTAGRGTKGQKSRAGGNLPAWFEGGQTPLHQRIPKLRGFRNAFKIQYEIVNLGAIARLVELGAFEPGEHPDSPKKGTKAAPITVNQEILRGAGLVRTLDRPMKVLGNGDLSTPLFVVADAFSSSARAKIEAAGGSVSVLEVPGRKTKALGVTSEAEAVVEDAGPEAVAAAPEAAPDEAVAPEAVAPEAVAPEAEERPTAAAAADEPAAEVAPEAPARPARAAKASAAAGSDATSEKPAKAARASKATAPRAARAADAAAPEADAAAPQADADAPAKPARRRKAASTTDPDAAAPETGADTGDA